MKTHTWRRRIAVAIAAAIAAGTAGTAPSAQAKTSRYGGDVKVAIFDTFPGFCVSHNPANSALMATRTIYETLVEKTIGGDYVGLLAESWWKSDDLRTWTVTLRPNIRFHDGTPFDAAAVVANLQAATGQLAAAALAKGGQAAFAAKAYTVGTGTAFLANIKGVEALDARTVRLSLDRPQNDVPGMLYGSGRIVMRAPSQLADAQSCGTKPIGTGPFMYVSHDANTLKVTKNPDYWRKDPRTGARLPYLDSITFANVKEGSQRSAAVRRGTYDAAMFAAATDATFIRDLRKRKSIVTEYRSPREYYPSVWMNQGKADSPFKNRHARLAVAHCIDHATFAKVRTKGEATPADSLVGPSSAMYTRKGFATFNPAKARRHAAAYRTQTGKVLEFSFPADTSVSSQMNANFLKNTWKRCGITAHVLVEEAAYIIASAFNSSARGATPPNAYDLIVILLMEGTDVSFNLPFLVSNAYPANSTNPVAPVFRTNVGRVLGLNHHGDTTVDAFFHAGQAAMTKAAAQREYRKATAYLQQNGYMTAITRTYYSLFATNRLAGIGTLQLKPGKTQRTMTNWGIDWTGVWVK